MSKLKGNSSLSITNIPDNSKIGLLDSRENITKSFRLSKEAVNVLKSLIKRFEQQSKTRKSEAEIVELALFAIEDLSLKDLIKDPE